MHVFVNTLQGVFGKLKSDTPTTQQKERENDATVRARTRNLRL
jgi:hypothetical protein